MKTRSSLRLDPDSRVNLILWAYAGFFGAVLALAVLAPLFRWYSVMRWLYGR